ncbi:MAG: DUF58 domain-containing protein [Phycisphaeraceae bacterium]|nr:DUF58 domain-containing protein [Phycisphaeraceae bacterium]
MGESNAYLRPEVLGRIANLGLRARRVVEGVISGQHRSPMHGLDVEFASYREYAPGDDLKRLDWRVYGRSNRYYIKQYEEESNLRATILMDASASMAYPRHFPRHFPRFGSRARSEADLSMTKYDYAATVAASLAALLVRQRDAVGLAMFDDERREVIAPAATAAQLAKIVHVLEQANPQRSTRLGDVMLETAERLRRRGMVIIISDLLTDLDRFHEGLGRFQHQGHDILVVQVLHADELDLPFDGSVQFNDLESDADVFAEPRFFRRDYQQAMQSFCEDIARRCRGAGIDTIQLRTDMDLGLALSHFLFVRSRITRRT